jgi:hypothetical protein
MRLLSAAPGLAGWSANPAEELSVLYNLYDDVDHGRGLTTLIEWLQAPETPLPAPVMWFMNLMACFFNDMKALSCLLHSVPALMATKSEVRSNVVPCLAIVGANDHMKVFAERMAAVVPNLELLAIPGSDHYTTLVNRKISTALTSFLDRHTP